MAAAQTSLAQDFLERARQRKAQLGQRPPMSLDAFRAKYGPDPDGFYDYCDLLEVKPQEGGSATGRIPFKLSPIQRGYCEARTPRDVVLKPRQVWITQVELTRDVWYFLTKRGVNVVVICQSDSSDTMLGRLSERVGIIFESLRKNAGLVLDFKIQTRTSWVLPDGSSLQIIGAGASRDAAQKKARGDTVHRLHTTEIAFCEYAGLTLNAVLEAIAGPEHGTEVVHESTANGAGGEERPESAKDTGGGPYFYWLCRDAREQRSGYKLHFFSWLQHPDYRTALEPGETVTPDQQPNAKKRQREEEAVRKGATPEQLKWYRGKLEQKGVDDTDQEYPIDPDRCFLVTGRGFFDKDVTDKLLGAATPAIEVQQIRRDGAVGTLSIWKRPVKGARYVIPGDTAEGGGGDRSGGHVYERGTGEHCATLSGQFKPGELATELAAIGYRYNTAEIAVERNNHGAATLQELQREGFDPPAGIDDVAEWLKNATPEQLAKARKAKYPAIFYDRDSKPGWLNVEVKRVAALDALEAAHRRGEYRTRDRAILGEFRTFVVSKTGKAEGARGAFDDHVIMAAIGWDRLTKSAASAKAPAAPSLLIHNADDRSVGW